MIKKSKQKYYVRKRQRTHSCSWAMNRKVEKMEREMFATNNHVSVDYLNDFYYRFDCCYDYIAFDHVQWCC